LPLVNSDSLAAPRAAGDYAPGMNLRRALLLVLSPLLGGIGGCATPRLFAPDRAGGFVLQAGPRPYYVYLPAEWSAGRSWPVIVYLHGMGESGDDGVSPTQVGLGPVVWRSKGAFPAIVVFPQAPRRSYWGMPRNNEAVLAALDEVLASYHGDPSRVYLTGSSLGGYGTWFLGSLHPERFAALVPICGGVRGRAPSPDAPMAGIADDQRAAEAARRIGRTPVWIFHGALDPRVPVGSSRELYQALKAAGGDVRYTEYPDVGHDSWDRAYADPELLRWLLAQRLAPGAARPAPSRQP